MTEPGGKPALSLAIQLSRACGELEEVRGERDTLKSRVLALLQEVAELRGDFARMAVLGNLVRSRTTNEQDELTRLLKKASRAYPMTERVAAAPTEATGD